MPGRQRPSVSLRSPKSSLNRVSRPKRFPSKKLARDPKRHGLFCMDMADEQIQPLDTISKRLA